MSGDTPNRRQVLKGVGALGGLSLGGAAFATAGDARTIRDEVSGTPLRADTSNAPADTKAQTEQESKTGAPEVEWDRVYDSDVGGKPGQVDRVDTVARTDDGDFVFLGYSNERWCLGKVDGSNGNLLWTEPYPQELRMWTVIPTDDGGYVLGGDSIEDDTWHLIKMDEHGTATWKRSYSDPMKLQYSRSLVRTEDGGYALFGTAGGLDVKNPVLLKVDSEGRKEWQKAYEQPVDEYGGPVIQTSDGGYLLIIGESDDSCTTKGEIKTVKTDADGTEVWSRTDGDFDYQRGASSALEYDDGYVVLGQERRPDETIRGGATDDLVLTALDRDGNKRWERRYGNYEASPTDDTVGGNVIAAPDGGFAFTGRFGDAEGIIETDSTGKTRWHKLLPERDMWTNPNTIVRTDTGGYVVGAISDNVDSPFVGRITRLE